MIKLLEKLLYQKTEGTQSEVLFAQWNYDKKIIPVALNNVSNLFPHYSLHDESHSITIINNIVRVLGKEKIETLSAIDIWLILEASYCHDIGMVVSSEKLIEALQSDEFVDFFREIQQNKKNGLYDFATQFSIENKKIHYNSSELSLEYHDGIKFILAEFFRRKHSDRSRDIIIDPGSELQLSSPRGVIPQRIFKILADICSSHTKNFDDVLKLPFCEVGIDIEDAHPRFISCLLRIGDLLDLDNNRFSEVMLRTLSKIPIDTLNHKAKHLSIESFRVDNEIIDVRAKCTDYDTANITQHWFNYLNSEISQQMINWNNIVPFKDFGYLPTIGNLKVELHNYNYIDGRKKPKFSVDTDKALELLQGAGIYEGAYQCIREVLQNAIDATLLRIWLEFKDDKDLSYPNSVDFEKIKNDFSICVTIDEGVIIGEYKSWNFIIEDNGIGLSNYDLSFLMNTGSSSKNSKKMNLIDSMPLWLRPSGIFGIGFQSIFMLTEQVKLETKSFFTEEFQIIELNSPNSIKDGGVLIQKIKTNHKTKPGTRLSFTHKTKIIPERWSVKTVQKNATRITENYDPFLHDSLDIELGKVFDEVVNFALKSYIPIKLVFNGKEVSLQQDKCLFKYFEKSNSLELNIYTKIRRHIFWTYYKNQYVENNLSFKFLGFDVNIHNEKASDILTLNRNKILPHYIDKLNEQFLTSAFEIITKEFNEIFDTEESKCFGSMFLEYYSHYEFLKRFDVQKFHHWENFKIKIDGKDYQIKKLLRTINELMIVQDRKFQSGYEDVYKIKNDKLSITLKSPTPSNDYTLFFLYKFIDGITSIPKVEEIEADVSHVTFSKKESRIYIDESELKDILESRMFFLTARCIIPCLEKYAKLRLNDNAYKWYIYQYRFEYSFNFKYPKMLSPFVCEKNDDDTIQFQIGLNDKLYNWVYENRYNEQVTLDEIKESYQKFIEEYKVEGLRREF